jgi:O-antigen/teichoic acid export membrane protein
LVLTGFMNVAYPIVARLDAANDQARLSLVMRQGSRLLLWGHLALLVPMAFATPLMLHLYVGQNYVQLAGWLSLWLLTLTTLHHTIISSFVITRGKVRLLALGALFNAALSLGLARLFAAQWGVAAMVLSYGVFMVFQMLVTYLLALPAAGGGSGGRALLTVLPAPVLAAGLAGGLSVALMAWMQWPLWCGAPAFLAFFALLAIGPGHVLRDLRLLR